MTLAKRYLLIFLICFIILNFLSIAIAWDNKTTHKDLSDVAAQQSILNIYLVNNLNIQKGIDEKLLWAASNGTNQSIRKWIQDGANFEDTGVYGFFSTRPYRHFHNPLSQYNTDQWVTAPAPYYHAGLDDYFYLYHVTGESAIHWVQDGENQLAYDGEDWSWQNTRTHYYIALTSQTKTVRDAELAQTFVGIGHVIHLLQDMSQPAHVRDDAHPEDAFGAFQTPFGIFRWVDRLENWAYVHQNNSVLDDINLPPFFPTVSTTNSIGPGLVPITAFWDTDAYTGSSPVSQIETNIGLAEYTNSNYFSDDTINPSSSWHNFPFPSKTPANYGICFGRLPTSNVYQRAYLGRQFCNADGTARDHFAAISLMNYQTNQPDLRYYVLDDNVYADYAKDLLPRAVGYSASLINYFFRGNLVLEGAGIDSNGNYSYRIENRSPEALNSGTLEVYYDKIDDTRLLLASIPIGTPIATGQVSGSFLFNTVTPPTDNKTPGRYWIVFEGKLGGEEGAVIGSYSGAWIEDWDKGITGTHNWWNSQLDPDAMFTLTGGLTTSTTQYVGNPPVSELKLTNFRPAGTSAVFPGYGLQYQEMAIGVWANPYIDPYAVQYLDVFPVNVTANTALHLKVDAMSTNVPIPYQHSQCNNPSSPLNPGAWQAIVVAFNNGYQANFTVPGQEMPGDNYYVTLGQDFIVYPYTQIFQYNGIPFVEPLQITGIYIYQQLYYICDPTSQDQTQTLQIDYIKILGQ
jgi:hypothetical protein